VLSLGPFVLLRKAKALQYSVLNLENCKLPYFECETYLNRYSSFRVSKATDTGADKWCKVMKSSM